jgi:hypothetical protein
MPGDNAEWEAYDEGRVAERILVAAGALDLGAAIGWADGEERPAVAEFLGVTAPHYVRTIVSIGHPTERARQPRSAPGAARRPLEDLVHERKARTHATTEEESATAAETWLAAWEALGTDVAEAGVGPRTTREILLEDRR